MSQDTQWNLHNACTPVQGLVCSGRVEPGQFDEVAANGVKTVINLCPPGELDFDEQAYVQNLGMQYVNIPIAGPQDLTEENARTLAALIADEANNPALVHCQSGNRVGALYALASFLDGCGIDAALQAGRDAGLTKMEPMVRQLLEGWG